ncbi:hypothetical protein J6590_094335 [Homalodisca vitripennis]|nr:hypothetical protein J6590_094335 [Homalodisca vitripennis]
MEIAVGVKSNFRYRESNPSLLGESQLFPPPPLLLRLITWSRNIDVEHVTGIRQYSGQWSRHVLKLDGFCHQAIHLELPKVDTCYKLKLPTGRVIIPLTRICLKPGTFRCPGLPESWNPPDPGILMPDLSNGHNIRVSVKIL